MADGPRFVRLGAYPGREGEGLGLLSEAGEAARVVRVYWLGGISRESHVRLVREVARAADALHHPHIQAPLSLEAADGDLGLVTEYVDGESLHEILEAGGRLPPAIAARLIRDACEALHFAHEEGQEDGPFVHGWLRPGNLLVSRSGVTLVSGFGFAAARSVTDLLPWQSPEQVLGGSRAASRHSDVYGLGLLLYACLAGENPFAAEPDVDVAILSRPPPPLEPLGVPPALAAVARRALAVKAADRFLGADEMAHALDAAGEVASPGAVAAWVESLFPVGMGTRVLRQRAVEAAAETARQLSLAPSAPRPAPAEEVEEEQIVAEPVPGPGREEEATEDLRTGQFQFVAPPFPPPPPAVVEAKDILGEAPPRVRTGSRAAPRPPAEPGGAGAPGLPAPLPPPLERSRRFRALAVLVTVAGLALGYWLATAGGPREEPREPPPSPTLEPGRPPDGAQAESPTPSSPPPARKATAAASNAFQRSLLDVTASAPGDVLVDGRRAGRAPLSRTVRAGRHEVRLVNRNLGLDVARSVEVQGARTALRIEVGKGRLTVTAPPGAEISLDGHPVGTGQVRDLEIWEGRHDLVVTFAGARHEHAFQVSDKESYEYDVTAEAR
ncbi:MAG TPA: protein kinase [Anaeromyxobacteraceae bacterium]|nr:protein kinase [Anaeromyxobacteraceae bacterium]